MFDVGWTEMLVIAIVMIVVVGPKDLPGMLRTFGRMAAKLRGMAGDFQKQFNEALKDAELDDVKKSVDSLRSLNPMNEIRKQLNPFEQAAADVRSGLDTAMKPKPAPDPETPAASDAQPAEPLKAGATAMPGTGGAEAAKVAPAKPKTAKPAVTAKVAKATPPKAARASAAPSKAAKAKASPAKATGVASVKPAPAKTAAAMAGTKPVAAGAKKPAAKKPAAKKTGTAGATK